MPNISRNKILIGIGILAVILVLSFAFFAFTKVDAAMSVNSAFYVKQVIDEQPVNGKFLIINVTVKNNAKNPLTVSKSQFAPMINGKPVEKYSVFSGDGTDLPQQITIPEGSSKAITLVFDIGNQTPDSLEFFGPISWAPTYKTSTVIKEVSPTALFDGLNGTANIKMNMSASNIQNMNLNMMMNMNGTEKSTVQKTDDPNKVKTLTSESVKQTTVINGQMLKQSMGTSQVTNTEKTSDNSTSLTDITTGIGDNGTLDMLPKNMTKAGDTITTSSGVYKLNGSDTINIMGKKIDCWVVDGQYKDISSNITLNATIYYDKTTRIIWKAVINPQKVSIPGLSGTFTVQGEEEFTDTNMPLIGVAWVFHEYSGYPKIFLFF